MNEKSLRERRDPKKYNTIIVSRFLELRQIHE